MNRDRIFVNLDDNEDHCCPVATDLSDPGKFFDMPTATEFYSSDFVDRIVKFTLEYAAKINDREWEAEQKSVAIRMWPIRANSDYIADEIRCTSVDEIFEKFDK